MKENNRNYAFIDSQSAEAALLNQGWQLDWKKFRVYLREQRQVKKAYIFLDYQAARTDHYIFLQSAGFQLIAQQVNLNVELALQVMIDYRNYDQAVLVADSNDLFSAVKYLCRHAKLKQLLICDPARYAEALRQPSIPPEVIILMNNLRAVLARSDQTLKIQV